MKVSSSVIHVDTVARPSFFDLTKEVESVLSQSGVSSGLAVVTTPHTTCSVLIQEESHDRDPYGTEYLMQDLVNVLESVIPTSRSIGQYLHPGPLHLGAAENERSEEGWWSLNVDAHLRSVIIGRSATIAIDDGNLDLGEFGRVYFADFDQTRSRPRNVRITILGA